ncbi:2,4-dihydroxyhept-2-ene-1,7-dioic acid aldolase [Candidimonas humi]|uniref:HpcH/HpaI aldolase/citrate lyase family protein n=1 Tax=Candidimonas humi TaxID=683355 RepID=A0ABV8NZU0_9BURK|nr:aldolase/citrate lyase family protein [Candidimonas humi]MBV6304454.1 2,4-dihydroxyhept-2-ene-1,7-dioic acid aldolase [Candidimonas humi]
MRANTLKRTLAAGGTATNAWLSIPSSFSAEVVANCGFDAVTVDMQHGMIDFSQAMTMFQAISTTSAIPIGRPVCSSPVEIMRLLDAGAYGVICPQVDTAEIAEAVVSACRYPPVGARSFGPPRGVLYGGADYFQHANEEILVFVMIESRQAMDNLDRILDVKGIDGIFIGPNDLSLSFGGDPGCEPQGEAGAAIETVRQKASDRGLYTGIFCSDTDMCHRRMDQGFQLVNAANDSAVLKSGYVGQVSRLKKTAAGPGGKTGY